MHERRILVTGGAGFIGSHLCEELVQRGHHVICIDDYSSGFFENIVHLYGTPGFSFIEMSINEPLITHEQLRVEEIDLIFNLACPASPIAYQSDAVRTIQTNVMGMMNVLDFAFVKGARVLQASTSEVYGDPLEHPQKESYWGNVDQLSPRGCYDEGKRCAETLCVVYRKERAVDVKIVRIFNTYGPNMAIDDGRVVSNFIVQALRGESLTMYGEGKQTRSFQYVDDLIKGMISMILKNDFSGPVNLGNPNEFTMNELARLIIELTGSSSKIIRSKLPEADPKQRCPDISLAKKQLGWEPLIDLKDGLMRTINYFETKLETH